MKWLNSLKIAIIDKDITAIQNIVQEIPEINELARAEEALALVKEAILVVEIEKEKTLVTMKKLRQTKAFMENH